MSPLTVATGRLTACCVTLVLLLWCMGLFGRLYWTPDEPREAALAASLSGHLEALPTLAGVRFAEKPPLSYWLSGFSMELFGASAPAARLPQLLYALVSIISVWVLASLLLGKMPIINGAAPATAVVFATAALVCQVQVWLDTDALLIAGVSMSLAGMYGAFSAADGAQGARNRRLLGYLVMHTGLTLAFFAKNMAGWLVPALTFLCFIAWECRGRELRRWELYVGALLPAACIAAWAASVWALPDGARLLRVLFWNNLAGRALPIAGEVGANYSSGHPNWPGKYLLELPLYLLPWTALAASALYAAWWGTQRAGPLRPAWRFALCAALPGLLVLSAASTARGIYAAPCLVGFALLIGLWSAESVRPRAAMAVTGALIVLMACSVMAATVLLQWTVQRASGPALSLSLVGALAAMAAAVRFGFASRRPLAPSILGLAAGWSALLGLGTGSLIAAGNRIQDLPALASKVSQAAGPSPLLLWNPDETTLAWAQLYLSPGRWSAMDASEGLGCEELGRRLGAMPATVVLGMVTADRWSWATWRDYLQERDADSRLRARPHPQVCPRDSDLASALIVSAYIERPGGRGYVLWRLRQSGVSEAQRSESWRAK